MTGFLCSPRLYKYDGWFFEYGHHICWPLCKDGEPRKRAGDRFYDMIHKFLALPEEEQERYRVGGGCIAIGEND
jgi:hypothetical protein